MATLGATEQDGIPVSGGSVVADKFGYSTGISTLHASATETSNWTSPDIDVSGARRVMIVFDLTAFTGTSVTVTVSEKDTVSGKYVQIAASTAETGAKTVAFMLDESALAMTAGSSQELVLTHAPHSHLLRVATSGTWSAATFSVSAFLRPQ